MSIALLVLAGAASAHMLLTAHGPFDPPVLPWAFVVLGLLLVGALRPKPRQWTATRFSLVDAAAAGLVLAGLTLLVVRSVRGAGPGAAAREFAELFAAALVYVPARLCVRSPAQARVTIGGALAISAIVALASVPSALDAARDAFMMRRAAAVAATVARPLPQELAPEGWTLSAGATAARAAAQEAARTGLRVTTASNEGELRFTVPPWFVVAGKPLSASALVRSANARHLDLQLFQGSRSVFSSRYRPTGDWQTLEAELTAGEVSQPAGLDLNISPETTVEIEGIRLKGPKGVLRAVGADSAIWDPVGWQLMQSNARAEHVAATTGERVRLTASAGDIDFRGQVPVSTPRQAITVTAQIFARDRIVHLQLLSGDRVIDTAKHRGSGWETLVVTGTASSGPAAVDVDVQPGQVEVQSVALDASGRRVMLLGTFADVTNLAAPEEPKAAPPPPVTPPSYRDRLDALPSGLVASLGVLFLAAIGSLARRGVLAARIRDRLLVAGLTLLAVAAVAAAAFVPSLSHPGMAFGVLIGMAAVHPLPLQEGA